MLTSLAAAPPAHAPLQVQGQTLVPAAFMFEMALVTGRLLLDQAGGATSAAPMLCRVSIPAPLLLAAPSRQAALVTCQVAAANSSLQVQSAGSVHMSAILVASRSASQQFTAAAAPAPAAAILLPSQTASSVRPAVLTQLATHGLGSGEAAEHWVHPAALDASIHAGAVLGLSRNPAEASRLSIPAGLAAIAAPAKLGCSTAWAAAGNIAAAADGSATSDFMAAAGAGHSGSATRLHQLLSRPMRAAAKTAAPRLLYHVQWQAVHRAEVAPHQGSTAAGCFDKLAWRVSQPNGTEAVQLQPTAGGAAAVISNSIAWLQGAAAAKTSIGLHAAAAAVEGPADINGGAINSSTLAAIGVAGLLRTAAREQAAGSLYNLLSSQYNTAVPSQHIPSSSADAYGSAASGGAMLLPRLTSSSADERLVLATAGAPAIAGRVLVTGGLGDLGLLVGAWLAQQPGTHTVLLGRTAHGKQLPQGLLATDGLVSVVMADVGSREDVAALGGSSTPLLGLMHAGGLLADALLVGQTAAGVRAVLAPKLTGAQLLLLLAAAPPMQQAALFSSTAALIGPAGQANYAAANAALGALAAAHQRSGHSSTSILWGAWSVGMAGRDVSLAARISSSGMGLIAPAAGLHALAALVAQQHGPSIVATPFDWPRLHRAARGTVPPMFEEYVSSTEAAAASSSQHAGVRRTAAKPAAAPPAASVAAELSVLVQQAVGAQVRCCRGVWAAALALRPQPTTLICWWLLLLHNPAGAFRRAPHVCRPGQPGSGGAAQQPQLQVWRGAAAHGDIRPSLHIRSGCAHRRPAGSAAGTAAGAGRGATR